MNHCSLVPYTDAPGHTPEYRYEFTQVIVAGERFDIVGSTIARAHKLIKLWYLSQMGRYVTSRARQLERRFQEVAETFDSWRVTFTDSGRVVIYRDGFLVSPGEDARWFLPHANRQFDDNEPSLVDLETGSESIRFPIKYGGDPVQFVSLRGPCTLKDGVPRAPSHHASRDIHRVTRMLDGLEQLVTSRTRSDR